MAETENPARTPGGSFSRFLRAVFSVPKPDEVVDYARYQCSCHQRFGDDFWHLPLDECKREGGCNYQVLTLKKTRV